MIVTEAEAKTKECRAIPYQMSNYLVPSGSLSGDHAVLGKERAMCVATNCMMWRWAELDGVYLETPENLGQGYCGLAGKP